jgi:hypothetical protein
VAWWSHSVADQCGSIINYFLLTITNNGAQCQYAQTLYPSGVVLMGIGAAVGLWGLTMKDEQYFSIKQPMVYHQTHTLRASIWVNTMQNIRYRIDTRVVYSIKVPNHNVKKNSKETLLDTDQ